MRQKGHPARRIQRVFATNAWQIPPASRGKIGCHRGQRGSAPATLSVHLLANPSCWDLRWIVGIQHLFLLGTFFTRGTLDVAEHSWPQPLWLSRCQSSLKVRCKQGLKLWANFLRTGVIPTGFAPTWRRLLVQNCLGCPPRIFHKEHGARVQPQQLWWSGLSQSARAVPMKFKLMETHCFKWRSLQHKPGTSFFSSCISNRFGLKPKKLRPLLLWASNFCALMVKQSELLTILGEIFIFRCRTCTVTTIFVWRWTVRAE